MSPLPFSALENKPGRSPANRSLERGIEILRAFRPGSTLLGNGDIAERTGLSKATVSRLTQTLVGCGLLQLDTRQRAYRLAPAALSLAHAMRSGSQVLAIAAPHMRALAEQRRLNVGLAAPDRDEMVYLESIRYARRVALRHVVSGQRVPIELTSLGRAYMAVAPLAQRQALLHIFAQRRQAQWPALSAALAQASQEVREQGYCAAAWQPGVVALACPLVVEHTFYVLNVSLSTDASIEDVRHEFSQDLLAMAERVRKDLASQEPL